MLIPTGLSIENERDQGLTAWLSASPCRVSTPFTWSVLQHMGAEQNLQPIPPTTRPSHWATCGSVTGCSNSCVLTPPSPSPPPKESIPGVSTKPGLTYSCPE